MIFNLTAKPRVTQRKSDLTQLRASGLIPAVVYGADMESLSVSLVKTEFSQCYKKSFKELAFYVLDIEGKKYQTLLKEKQVHPVTRDFLHLDFMVIPATAPIEVDIPIKFIGEPAGLKEGGVMDVQVRTAKISCVADSIPEDLELDISGLQVGESLHISDLPKGNWEYKDHPEVALVVVHAKKTDAAPVAATEPTPES